MALSQIPQWVAAYTLPRAEKTVTLRITQELGLETYLPLHRVLRKWSDRMKSVELPLIPSYTFIKMRECDLWNVRDIYGICGFVSFPSTGIAVIPEQDIANLRQLADSDREIYIHNADMLRYGAHVRIVAGEFQGMEGTIVKNVQEGNFSVKIGGLNVRLVVKLEPDVLQVIP